MTGSDSEAFIAVWVQPRSSRPAISGVVEGRLRVRVAAPPLENRANLETCRLLARALGVAPSTVSIVAGNGGRRKLVRVGGLAAADVRTRLRV